MKSFVKRAALAVLLFAIPYANSFNLPSTHHRHHVINKLHNGRSSSSALYSTLEKKPKKSSSDVEDNFPNPEDVAALTTPEEQPSTKNILGSSIPYEDLTIGILKESYPGENRVSVAPESVKLLIDAGLNVVVESGGELYLECVVCCCVFFDMVHVICHVACIVLLGAPSYTSD